MENKNLLISFLKELSFDKSKFLEDSDMGFEERLRIQKLVYFAQKLGIEFRYQYTLYIHGPYSTDLAKEYYNIVENDWYAENETIPNWEKIKETILELNKMDSLWLETAATIYEIKLYNKNATKEEIIKHAYSIKNDVLTRNHKDITYVAGTYEKLFSVILNASKQSS